MAQHPRVEPVDPERLTPEQREVFDRIAGTRGRVEGPFTVLLHAPELADRVQQVGAYLRFETELERDLAETAVLATSRTWDSSFEWVAHEPHARSAGVPEAVIVALRADADLAALPERYRITAAYVRALASSKRISDEIYGATVALIGTKAIVELTVLVGYYAMLAMTLNAHEIAGANAPDPAEAASSQG